MGRVRRNKPRNLAKKLHKIRVDLLGLSQSEMARALGLEVHYAAVSNYELGTREPDLMVVLKYARLTGIPMEVLVDDNLNLPKDLS
jgi:transcriptional regulator with XRE-family HTH domain